jgi:hypothetical protein
MKESDRNNLKVGDVVILKGDYIITMILTITKIYYLESIKRCTFNNNGNWDMNIEHLSNRCFELAPNQEEML